LLFRGDDRPANSRRVPDKEGVEPTVGQAFVEFVLNEIQDIALANKLTLVAARLNQSNNPILLLRGK
jgi:hypothetical protein